MALRAVGLRRVQRGDTFRRVHPEFDIGRALMFSWGRATRRTSWRLRHANPAPHGTREVPGPPVAFAQEDSHYPPRTAWMRSASYGRSTRAHNRCNARLGSQAVNRPRNRGNSSLTAPARNRRCLTSFSAKSRPSASRPSVWAHCWPTTPGYGRLSTYAKSEGERTRRRRVARGKPPPSPSRAIWPLTRKGCRRGSKWRRPT
jgi:hypothetical protein